VPLVIPDSASWSLQGQYVTKLELDNEIEVICAQFPTYDSFQEKHLSTCLQATTVFTASAKDLIAPTFCFTAIMFCQLTRVYW
jgi:hypothetical protein